MNVIVTLPLWNFVLLMSTMVFLPAFSVVLTVTETLGLVWMPTSEIADFFERVSVSAMPVFLATLSVVVLSLDVSFAVPVAASAFADRSLDGDVTRRPRA